MSASVGGVVVSNRGTFAGRRWVSVGLDVRLANDAAICVVLLANVGPVVRAARTDGRESQNVEPFPDLGYLQCSREPVSELGAWTHTGTRGLFDHFVCSMPRPSEHDRLATDCQAR